MRGDGVAGHRFELLLSHARIVLQYHRGDVISLVEVAHGPNEDRTRTGFSGGEMGSTKFGYPAHGSKARSRISTRMGINRRSPEGKRHLIPVLDGAIEVGIGFIDCYQHLFIRCTIAYGMPHVTRRPNTIAINGQTGVANALAQAGEKRMWIAIDSFLPNRFLTTLNSIIGRELLLHKQ